MSSLTRALALLALAAVIVGAIAVAVTLESDHVDHPGLVAALGAVIGASWIGTGLYTWRRRPYSRLGALMVLVGFEWSLAALTGANAPGVFTAAVLLSNLYLAGAAHLLLAYPSGRLFDRGLRRFVAAGYVLAVLGPLPMLLVDFDRVRAECDCPPSAIEVSGSHGLAVALDVLTTVIAVAFLAYLLVLIVGRWRSARALQRRAMAPVLWSGVTLMALVAGSLTSQTARLPRGVVDVLGLFGLLAFASVPFAFLFGLLRSRWARVGAAGELLTRLGEGPGRARLRSTLADALGDPSLELAYWIGHRHRWVDRCGHPLRLPGADDHARAWTPVELEGRRVGALVHDASLATEPELVRSVATAAALAMENERLQVALQARVDELEASRARIVEAGVAERRRLERNLHDGAQQRLVALSLTIRLAQNQVSKDPERAGALLAAAQEELSIALEELRELARGIHPAVLSDRGLEAALEALAGRSPVPVRVAGTPEQRLPEPVEAAAYFVVAEALTNVVKYAQASEAVVSVCRAGDQAVVEVADDGVGGADPGRGTGLRGLADRVAALDGALAVDSPPGRGTRLRAEIPV